MDVVPKGTELEVQLRRGDGQAAHTLNNPQVKCTKTKLKLSSVALVREPTLPTERPPPVGEVSANFCG